MTKPDYPALAHVHLKKGRALLQTEDDGQLPYAALELPMSMEALTYERAQAYSADLPPRVESNSQPQKIMEFLLNIDPYADTDVTLQMSEEPAGTTETPTYITVGTERPLTLRQLKDYYHKMGFYLHIPTMAQPARGSSTITPVSGLLPTSSPKPLKNACAARSGT